MRDEAQPWSLRTVLLFWYHSQSHHFTHLLYFLTYSFILPCETIKKWIIPQYTTSKPLNACVCVVSRNNNLINMWGKVCWDFVFAYYIYLFYFYKQMNHRQVSFHRSILSSHLTETTLREEGKSSRMESCLEVYHLSSQKPKHWYLSNPSPLQESPGSPCITAIKHPPYLTCYMSSYSWDTRCRMGSSTQLKLILGLSWRRTPRKVSQPQTSFCYRLIES